MPAPDDLDVAALDLNDGWDPMQSHDPTAAAAVSPMNNTTNMLLPSCHAQPQSCWGSVSTAAASRCATETWPPAGCRAQPHRYYSSDAPPAADGINSVEACLQAADCNGQQRLAELSRGESRQVCDTGAPQAAGMKHRSLSKRKKQSESSVGIVMFTLPMFADVYTYTVLRGPNGRVGFGLRGGRGGALFLSCTL